MLWNHRHKTSKDIGGIKLRLDTYHPLLDAVMKQFHFSRYTKTLSDFAQV